jgi:hypothetical protein
MVISGVWHGADWGFIIWGALHAVARCLTRDLELTFFWKERVPRFVKQMLVFTFVTFTWIFFRAPRWEDASLILQRIFATGWDGPLDPQFPLLLGALVLAVWIYQLVYTSQSPLKNVLEWDIAKIGLAAGMIAYLMIVAQSSTKQFIYFQF